MRKFIEAIMTKQIDTEKLLARLRLIILEEEQKLTRLDKLQVDDVLDGIVLEIERGQFDAPEPEGWISVKSGLPEKRGCFLVFINKDHHPRHGYFSGSKKWSVDWESGEVSEIETITHWMPLPQPPAPEPKDE